MKMEIQLKILTLNCWGIVGISKDRKERFAAIATMLAEGEFDFVFLQEVWNQDNFNLVKNKVAPVLPHSQYFYSGVLGSGCCIFSKGVIINTGFLKYSLNGYFYKVQHGDWFGGKGVGLCKVRYNGLSVNLYNTHLHAEYSHDNDIYLVHRVTQAWQLSQYVNLTSGDADLSIVAGDFNAAPDDISSQIVRHNSSLYDSYEERENKNASVDYKGATCAHPRNSYRTKSEMRDMPDGQRIDYVFYAFPNGTNVRCMELSTPFDKVPSKQFSFSDHEAVVSHLLVKKSQQALGYESDRSIRMETLRSSKFIVQTALQNLRFNRLFYLLLVFVTAILLAISAAVFIPYPFNIILIPFRVILTLILTFGIFMALIDTSIERNILLSSMLAMETAISSPYPLNR